MRRNRWIWIAIVAALIVLAGLALDPRMTVRHYAVPLKGVTAPVRLAVITDFHGCRYGEDAAELLAAVESENPDAVLLVGDILDDEIPYDQSVALMKGLAARWPCYYVTGNHEYWSQDIDNILKIVAECGVTTLNATSATLTIRDQTLTLCGVTDPAAMTYHGMPDTAAQLRRVTQDCEGAACTVLLAHRPEMIGEYAACGFDLVVSGHAHGGQVRLPGLLNGLYAPNQGWFPDYAGGEYHIGDTTLIVSRGLARESTRLPRVFNRPELVIVTLE